MTPSGIFSIYVFCKHDILNFVATSWNPDLMLELNQSYQKSGSWIHLVMLSSLMEAHVEFTYWKYVWVLSAMLTTNLIKSSWELFCDLQPLVHAFIWSFQSVSYLCIDAFWNYLSLIFTTMRQYVLFIIAERSKS